jgi:hypothetical protein
MTQIITFLIFGGFGAMFLVVGARQWLQQRRRLAAMQPVEAVVVDVGVRSGTSSNTDTRLLRDNSTTTHEPVVRFRYRLGGREYESDMLRPTNIVRTYASRDAAIAVLKPYAPGARIRALVDPAEPDKAFLIAEAGAGPAVFLVLGVLLPPIAWFVGGLI